MEVEKGNNMVGGGRKMGGQCELLVSEGISSLWPVGQGQQLRVAKSKEKSGSGADFESNSQFLAAPKTRYLLGSQRECHGS